MEENTAKKIEEIRAKILPFIRPSSEEIRATTAHANMIMDRLRKVVPKDVEVRVVGSIARNTNISGDADIDIFMLFDKSKRREDIVKSGIQYAKKIVKKGDNERYEIRYAEHPYLRLYLDDYDLRVDVVPAFKIENISDRGTAVDRTPLHTEFINSHLTERQRDDVRLLKYLLKVHGIYGAEIKTKGFSGYLCELLIYHYGSFAKLLDSISTTKLPLCIDVARGEVINDERIFKKFNSDFIVIDPVDPNRNVAAVVSKENFARFIILARELLRKPSTRFFDRKRIAEDKMHSILKKFLHDTGLKPIIITVRVPDKSNDVIWPQLNKTAMKIKEAMENFGFSVYLVLSWVDRGEGVMLYLLPEQKLNTRLMKGPDVTSIGPSDAFLKAHKKAYGIILNGLNIYALERNRYARAEDVARDVIKNGMISGSADIRLRGRSRIYTALPRKYSFHAYEELILKISI